jgi:hypothetical protein
VFLYLIPALLFLLPTSLVAAELASGRDGGVYKWVGLGLSRPLGFLAVWCQFAMTIFYSPSLLAYVASTFAYLINPALAANGLYVAIVIITLFWAGVFLSSHGTKTVAGLSSMGLVIGTLIPGVLLVVPGLVFLGQGNPSAAPMTASHLLPAWTGLASLVLIVNNFLSYAGMEMNAVHVSSLRDPAREFPRAMFLAMGLVLAIFIIPSLVISWVVPAGELSLTAGVMQAFSGFFAHFGIGFLTPVMGVALIAAAPDALAALIHLLAALRDEAGNTTIDGLPADRAWPGVSYPEEQFRADAGLLDGVRVTGDGTVADMLWARPALTVLGIDCPAVVGSSAAIQPSARARLNLRIPPGPSRPRRWPRSPSTWRPTRPGRPGSPLRPRPPAPFTGALGGPAYSAMSGALRAAYGREPTTEGQGGSIPLCNVFQQTFPDAEIMLLGVEEPKCLIHAPNESVDPAEIEHMSLAEALFLATYGAA